MNVPSWWETVLLAGAAYRVWRLVAFDTITERWRAPLIRREKVRELVECPWCLGFWITLAWWAAWQVWPHTVLVAAAPFMLSLAVGLVSRVDP